MIIAGIVFGLLGGSERLPDPSTIELEEVPEIMRSSEFWALDPDKRHNYIQETMRSLLVRTVREYAEQPPDKQEEYLENLKNLRP